MMQQWEGNIMRKFLPTFGVARGPAAGPIQEVHHKPSNKIISILKRQECMKGLSTIDPDAIRKHQANNSSSKNAYQFSKEKRFPNPNPECKVAFYSNDSRLSNRKTSFGCGNKYDFTKDRTHSPAATKYLIKSVFEESKGRGRSFGLSRELSPDQSYLVPQLQKVPGPGQYENQVKTRMHQSFTMRPKTIDFIEDRLTNKKNPGPGNYETVDMDPKTGRFTVSKFGDSKFAKFNPKTPRFPEVKESPGPLSYREGDSLAGNAKYVLSQRKGNGTRAFSQTARTTFTDDFKKKEEKLPGPGYYQRPSDFGSYGDAKYYKTLGSFKSAQD